MPAEDQKITRIRVLFLRSEPPRVVTQPTRSPVDTGCLGATASSPPSEDSTALPVGRRATLAAHDRFALSAVGLAGIPPARPTLPAKRESRYFATCERCSQYVNNYRLSRSHNPSSFEITTLSERSFDSTYRPFSGAGGTYRASLVEQTSTIGRTIWHHTRY